MSKEQAIRVMLVTMGAGIVGSIGGMLAASAVSGAGQTAQLVVAVGVGFGVQYYALRNYA